MELAAPWRFPLAHFVSPLSFFSSVLIFFPSFLKFYPAFHYCALPSLSSPPMLFLSSCVFLPLFSPSLIGYTPSLSSFLPLFVSPLLTPHNSLLFLRWYRTDSETPLRDRDSRMQLPDGSLFFYRLRGRDRGTYYCVARNAAGTATSRRVTVQMACE